MVIAGYSFFDSGEISLLARTTIRNPRSNVGEYSSVAIDNGRTQG